MNNYAKAEEILNLYGQEHLLNLYETLTAKEKKSLLNQIFKIDFEQILELY